MTTISKEQAQLLMSLMFNTQISDLEYYSHKELDVEGWKNTRYNLWFKGSDIICYSDNENPIKVQRYELV